MTMAIKKVTLTYKEGATSEALIFFQSGEVLNLENYLLGGNSCGWLASEVEAWISERAAARSEAGK